MKHERKDEIRKYVPSKLQIEHKVSTLRRKILYPLILYHNDDSSKDHEPNRYESHPHEDALHDFGLFYTFEGENGAGDEEEGQPEEERAEQGHLGQHFGQDVTCHYAF